MKRKSFLTLTAVLAAVVSACGSGGSGKATTSDNDSGGNTMTIITSDDLLIFGLGGSGMATIAWGNQKETAELSDDYVWLSIEIPDINSRTITITGNIIGFDCAWGGFTEIDVSKSSALTNLNLTANLLKRLDLSKNSALKYVDIKANQFTAAELNNMFGTLHGRGGTIVIAYNPGTDDCKKSIAEAKGWVVETTEPEEH